MQVMVQMVKNQCAVWETQPWLRKMPRRREWLTTPESLPGESHGQGSLVSYSPWGHKELDITELLTHIHPYFGCVLIMSPCHLYNLYW